MNKLEIDTKVCEANNMTIQEVLLGILVKLETNIDSLMQDMINEEKLLFLNNSYAVTSRWNDVIDTILLDSQTTKQPEERFIDLVTKLQEIFPKGKKDGTSQYWRGNRREIELRLKKFFALYGNTYSNEQIIEATKRYVESFNGQYTYMRVLKYFIWKNDKQSMEDGIVKVVEVSDLANFIENEDIDNIEDGWTSTLN